MEVWLNLVFIVFYDKYFLSFVKDTSKIISYALSIGSNAVENSSTAERIQNITVMGTQDLGIINDFFRYMGKNS